MTAGRLFTGQAKAAAVRYDLPEYIQRPFEVPVGVAPGVLLRAEPDIDED